MGLCMIDQQARAEKCLRATSRFGIVLIRMKHTTKVVDLPSIWCIIGDPCHCMFINLSCHQNIIALFILITAVDVNWTLFEKQTVAMHHSFYPTRVH